MPIIKRGALVEPSDSRQLAADVKAFRSMDLRDRDAYCVTCVINNCVWERHSAMTDRNKFFSGWRHRLQRSPAYLPTSTSRRNLNLSPHRRRRHWRLAVTKRCGRLSVFCFIALSVVGLLSAFRTGRLDVLFVGPHSTLYDQYHDYERNLPQHDLSLPFPEGKHAKFVWFANHGSGMWYPRFLNRHQAHFPSLRGDGWGNAMQELLLNAHLAYSANRA